MAKDKFYNKKQEKPVEPTVPVEEVPAVVVEIETQVEAEVETQVEAEPTAPVEEVPAVVEKPKTPLGKSDVEVLKVLASEYKEDLQNLDVKIGKIVMEKKQLEQKLEKVENEIEKLLPKNNNQENIMAYLKKCQELRVQRAEQMFDPRSQLDKTISASRKSVPQGTTIVKK